MYFLHGISFEYAHVAYTDGLGGCPISLRYSSAEYERTRRRAHPLVKSRAGRRGGSRVRGPDTTSSSPRASFAGAPAASRIPQRRRGRTSHVLKTCPDRAASLGICLLDGSRLAGHREAHGAFVRLKRRLIKESVSSLIEENHRSHRRSFEKNRKGSKSIQIFQVSILVTS